MTRAFDKSALRLRMRGLRRRLADENPDAAAELPGRLPNGWLPDVAAYSLYYPTGSEIDPRHIRLAVGRPVLPVAVHRDEPLIFRAYEPEGLLVTDAYGVPSPPPSAPELVPDIVFAPVLAFDLKGGRLGQGGGHYDRTVANLRAAKPVFVIGVAYAGQEVDEIPMEPHDQRLDAILTETGYIEVGQG